MSESAILWADWPAPPGVRACVTTRRRLPRSLSLSKGTGESSAYADFNLALHVGDDPQQVLENRDWLRESLDLPAEPAWLSQCHGAQVLRLPTDQAESERQADASVAFGPGQVCAVLTADCLPVLFCNRAGTRIAAAHAGWRGLAGGVLEAAVAALDTPPEEILAWLGPAIGPQAFEVGEEVRAVFLASDAEAAQAFTPRQPAKWLADLYQLARLRLARIGVTAVYGGGRCTYSEAAFFYSYRRQRETGRMASLIWIQSA